MSSGAACEACLRRTWLLGRLAGNLDQVRARIGALLELDDETLIAAVAGAEADQIQRERDGFSAPEARARCAEAGVEQLCRCQDSYPAALRALPAPPAVLHIAGDPGLVAGAPAAAGVPAAGVPAAGVPAAGVPAAGAPGAGVPAADPAPVSELVAIVGARRASSYALGAARALARGLGSADLTVVSGMAFGIDAAAHAGALDAGAPTVAVLASAPERPYPATARALHRRIRSTGAVVSELGPGIAPRRWMFPARNRIIAALSAMTVVVAARAGSGALLTADCADALGRPVGAVPGEITAPLASGPHALIRAGADLIRGPEDVLETMFGAGVRPLPRATRPPLTPQLQRLLEALADGAEPARALRRAGLDADGGLAALAALELEGRIRREGGGRFIVLP